MEFGISVMTSTHSWKVVQRAEALGFSHAWFYDSQLLCADVYAVMALAAANTSRIRLGTGVAIPSNRIVPVTASALATLNELAPGRIMFGVGTGFTGRRCMGLNAVKLEDMARYVEEVYALLGEETVEVELEGKRRKIRLLHPDRGMINTRDPIALHMSAMGPKARATCARMNAGWITVLGNDAAAIAELGEMQQAWAAAGQAPDGLHSTALTLGCVLAAGEAADSPRAMAQAGPLAAIVFHNLVEAEERGSIMPMDPAWAHALAGFKALYETYEPADARYLDLHTGHLLYVRDDERHLLTAEIIRQLSFTGTETELRGRIEALRDAGYRQLVIQVVEGQEHALDDWARVFKGF